jgi:hypothetical protein
MALNQSVLIITNQAIDKRQNLLFCRSSKDEIEAREL